MPGPDVGALEQTTSDLRAAVAQHRSDAASLSQARDCNSAVTPYFVRARPLTERMRGLAGSIDACMRAMSLAADSRSMCDAMSAELDRHEQAACAGDTGARNVEIVRHCDAMDEYLASEATVASQMRDMMSAGMMSGGMCGH
jgi:hypothetical protein